MSDIVGYVDEKVIALLSLSLVSGTPILLGKSNIEHMKRSHPEDFVKYFVNIKEILCSPDYVNLNPLNKSVKYIKQIDEHVVVGIRISGKGQIFARTLFVFPPWKFEQYMAGGYLVPYK